VAPAAKEREWLGHGRVAFLLQQRHGGPAR